MALPLLAEPSELVLTTPLVSRAYVDMTLDALRRHGVTVLTTETGWRIPAPQVFQPDESPVEGDWSAGGWWLAANALQGGGVTVTNLPLHSSQPDRVITGYLQELPETVDVSQTPDLLPALALLAAMRPQTTRFTGGAFLRRKESDRLHTVAAVLAVLPWILGVEVLVAVCTVLFSNFLTKKIVAPINRLDLDHPADNEIYDELSPLLGKINHQNEVIAQQMRSLREKQEEFTSITENMSEGLFVVDRNYQILSYNKSAMQIFGMDPRQEHENLLAVNRSEGFRNAVDSALKGRHTQENLELNRSSPTPSASLILRKIWWEL